MDRVRKKQLVYLAYWIIAIPVAFFLRDMGVAIDVIGIGVIIGGIADYLFILFVWPGREPEPTPVELISEIEKQLSKEFSVELSKLGNDEYVKLSVRCESDSEIEIKKAGESIFGRKLLEYGSFGLMVRGSVPKSGGKFFDRNRSILESIFVNSVVYLHLKDNVLSVYCDTRDLKLLLLIRDALLEIVNNQKSSR
jgi:hypothetical protein